VLIPEVFGIHGKAHNVCVEDTARLDTVESLLYNSKAYLEAQWGLSIGEPKIIFCNTARCQFAFGLANKAGFTLGSLAIVSASTTGKS